MRISFFVWPAVASAAIDLPTPVKKQHKIAAVNAALPVLEHGFNCFGSCVGWRMV
jgi:hypothetical protein